MSQGIKISYPVDIVLCIDATGSMSPVIESTKKDAQKFHKFFQESMESLDKEIQELRVKVIAYRDLKISEPMEESPFYILPQDEEAFASFVNNITAKGGGDEPESALEAIEAAINSDWSTSQDKKRNVVVIWTDASPHMDNIESITDKWNNMEFASKRLIMFCPEHENWNVIYDNWENALHVPSKAGEGLAEASLKEMLNTIAGSIVKD